MSLILPAWRGIASSIDRSASTASWQIVGQYGEISFGGQTVASGSERRFHRIPIDPNVDITALKVLNHAFIVNSSNSEVALTNDLVVGHGWNINGTVYADSSRTTVTAGLGVVESSLLTASTAGLSSFAAGDRIWLNREVDVPSGGGQSYQSIPYVAGTIPTGYGRKTLNLSTTDLSSASPSGLSASGGYSSHPRGVVGLGVHGYTFGVLGDSIAYNNSDTNLGDGGSSGTDGRTAEGGGWVRRSFQLAGETYPGGAKKLPFTMMARGSATLTGLGSARRAIYPYISVLVFQIGTNDLSGGATAAQLKTLVETEITTYKAAFSAVNPTVTPKAVVCTIVPRVPSHGGTSTNTEFSTYNGYVRAGSIAGSDGYLDPNAAVADGSNELIWGDINYEVDGVHPTTLGHTTIAAAIYPVLQQATPWQTF